jgi:hypothetical protein
MISCTEFIAAYSELFKFLEKEGGPEAVLDFWNYFTDHLVGTHELKQLVEENGIRGCWLYWQHTLNEEAADFTMELDEEVPEFRLTMDYCPSKGRLLQWKHLEPYHNYCGHCNAVYRRILEPLGYEYIFDGSENDKAKTKIIVRPNSVGTQKGGST